MRCACGCPDDEDEDDCMSDSDGSFTYRMGEVFEEECELEECERVDSVGGEEEEERGDLNLDVGKHDIMQLLDNVGIHGQGSGPCK
jgi:hypothetical protein